jgi:hypothetical protein
VFVELEYTPLIYRAASASGRPLQLETHAAGSVAELRGAWIDEQGSLLLETEHGIGILHDRDLDSALPALIDANGTPLPEDALEAVMALLQEGGTAPVWFKVGEQSVKVQAIRSGEVAGRFGYTPKPTDPSPQEAVAADR